MTSPYDIEVTFEIRGMSAENVVNATEFIYDELRKTFLKLTININKIKVKVIE